MLTFDLHLPEACAAATVDPVHLPSSSSTSSSSILRGASACAERDIALFEFDAVTVCCFFLPIFLSSFLFHSLFCSLEYCSRLPRLCLCLTLLPHVVGFPCKHCFSVFAVLCLLCCTFCPCFFSLHSSSFLAFSCFFVLRGLCSL